MLRTLRNNSKDETKNDDLNQCISYFEASGYNPKTLGELKEKAISKMNTINVNPSEPTNTLVFPLHFFDGVTEFKTVVRNLTDTFKELIGDTRILFALKKSISIRNRVVITNN